MEQPGNSTPAASLAGGPAGGTAAATATTAVAAAVAATSTAPPAASAAPAAVGDDAPPPPAPGSRSARKAPVSVAGLKPEYVIPVPTDDNGSGDGRPTAGAASRYNPLPGGGRSKRGRGLLNSRRKSLCANVAIGRPCTFEGECRHGHDVAGFMAKKPADAGPECTFFRRHGYCPQGFCCRFGDCHIDLSDPQHPRLVELSTAQPPAGPDLDTNAVTPAMLQAIRLATRALKQAKREAAGEEPHEDGGGGGGREGGLKKKKRKGKRKGEKGVPEHLQQCRQFAAGLCTYGDKCRWSHHTVPAPTPAAAAVATPAGAVAGGGGDGGLTVVPDEDPTRQFSRHVRAALAGAGQVARARKPVDFSGKVYVAPLTTVGNLPFRRIVKRLGADITCGEMALATSLLAGNMSEWALLRRHPEEDVFGVQVAGHHADHLAQCCAILDNMNVDFVDLNMGCPIDLIVNSGAGSAAMRPNTRGKMGGAVRRFEKTVARMHEFLPNTLLTLKMRTGWVVNPTKWSAARFVLAAQQLGCVDCITIHGRSREGRYYTTPDWGYVESCAANQSGALPRIPIVGNGDVYNWTDWADHLRGIELAAEQRERDSTTNGAPSSSSLSSSSRPPSSSSVSPLSSCMLARGALIKPWLPTEIKEKRDWDISAPERLDIVKEFCNNGLEHWGSDGMGVEKTRRFFLEWQSFLCRYVPVGLLERVPMRVHEKVPLYRGRSDLETWLGSRNVRDWVKLSEMFLGPVPKGFTFEPKHKANAYAPESGFSATNMRADY